MREDKNWSHQTLATKSELDKTTIIDIEAGNRVFNIDTHRRLADGFGMKGPELLKLLE